MPSIRRRTTVIIAAIAALVLAAGMGAGMYISQRRFTQTLKDTLVFSNSIASDMIARELERLKEETLSAALQVEAAASGDVPQVLEALADSGGDSPYLAFSVLHRDGTVLSSGDSGARPLARMREGEYGRRAFAGETVITTTAHTPQEQLVMRIWTPVDGERVLAASVAGLHLSDILAPYSIWDTGRIFLVDGEGTIIACNGDTQAVLERRNYIEMDNRYPEYRETALAFLNFTRNGAGTEQYSAPGTEMLCAYRTIEGTDHWTLATSVPLEKSPFAEVTDILILCAIIILIFAIIAAQFAARCIHGPGENDVEPHGGPSPVSVASGENPAPAEQEEAPEDEEGILKNANIPGLNIARGLALIGDDEETYEMILRAYAAHTPAFIKTVRAQAAGNIDEYRIAVHGIKGSSRSIGAEKLGDAAKKLELAANENDTAFIKANTGAFVETAEKFIGDLKAFLKKLDSLPGRNKPEKDAPDPELLAEIERACKAYDISALQKAIDALDSYTYSSAPGIGAWLREQADISGFEEILLKLGEENSKN